MFVYLFVKGLLEIVALLLFIMVSFLLLTNLKSPYNVLVGVPLFFGGTGLLFGVFFGLTNNLISRTYLKGMCIFCLKK